LNVKFESPSSEILPRLVFNIYTFLIFPGNLGMYDSWLFEQVADIQLQVQDGLGHSICVSMLLLERPHNRKLTIDVTAIPFYVRK
jgi:hypothetical protein